MFYDDKWFAMKQIKINNDTDKIKKINDVHHH